MNGRWITAFWSTTLQSTVHVGTVKLVVVSYSIVLMCISKRSHTIVSNKNKLNYIVNTITVYGKDVIQLQTNPLHYSTP